MLVSLYMRDANTSRALQIVNSLSQPLVYSALHRLEIRNAFSLAVFRGHQTPEQAIAARRNLEVDLRARVLIPISIKWQAAFREASTMAEKETPSLGSRSFDILHVACAKQVGVDQFLTFDHRQSGLAAQVGLSVRP